MKYATSFLTAIATITAGVSAAATPKFYTISVTQPSSSQVLSIAWDHSGATSIESDLEPIEQFPSIDYYFQDGRLLSPVYSTAFPDYGYSFEDVNATEGAIAIVGGQFGLNGRDDWIVGSDGSLTVPAQGPASAFFQCQRPVEGGIANVLAYGNPFANGSLPQGCTSTVELFVQSA